MYYRENRVTSSCKWEDMLQLCFTDVEGGQISERRSQPELTKELDFKIRSLFILGLRDFGH